MRVADEVPDDQEVTGEPLGLDDGQFVFELVAEGLRRLVAAPFETLLAQVPQHRLRRFALRDRIHGRVVPAEPEPEVAPAGDLDRVGQRVRQVREAGLHLFVRLQVKLPLAVPHPVRVRKEFPRVDAQQDVVGPGVVGREVMHVVRRDQGDAHLACQADEHRPRAAFVLDGVVLDLQIEILGPEDFTVLGDGPAGTVLVARQKTPRNLALEAGRQADETLGMLGEDLFIDTRPIIKTVQVGGRREAQQVAVPSLVGGEQNEVVSRVLASGQGFPVLPSAGRDVGFIPEDRLDAGRDRRLVELDRAEQVAVVRDGDGPGALAGGGLDEVADPARAVQEAVLRVNVEMNERWTSHRPASLPCVCTGAMLTAGPACVNRFAKAICLTSGCGDLR